MCAFAAIYKKKVGFCYNVFFPAVSTHILLWLIYVGLKFRFTALYYGHCHCQWCRSFYSKLGLDNWQFYSAIQFPLYLIRSNTVHFSCFFPTSSLASHASELCLVTVCSFSVYMFIWFVLHFHDFTIAVYICCRCTECEFYRLFHGISLWLSTSKLLILFCQLFSVVRIFFSSLSHHYH